MNDLTIELFQPVRLRIEGAGPFPTIPYEIDFTDEEGQPCNVFLLMSENGMGEDHCTGTYECHDGVARQKGNTFIWYREFR